MATKTTAERIRAITDPEQRAKAASDELALRQQLIDIRDDAARELKTQHGMRNARIAEITGLSTARVAQLGLTAPEPAPQPIVTG